MSNPLRWFRQNSKILVVFLGIGAMAIFGLGPVFDVLSRSSSYDEGGQNPVVATWKGGELKRSDLDMLRRRHYDVLRFQQGVQQAAVAQKGEEYQPFVAPIQAIRDSNETAQAQIDDQLMERMLLAEKATAEGFVISDGMIDDFLALLAGEAEFSRADLEAINIEANQRSCSLEQVRRHLKTELLYRQMRVMASSGKPIFPNPTESMELYSKISNRIECEVIPVPVSQFVDEVTEEPSNATLRSLYKDGKSQYPDPTGEEPGFKVGRRLVAQYFIADYDTFQQNEINKLTDAQVEAEYDRLVAAEDDMVMEVIPEEVEDDVVTPDESSEEAKPKADGQSINVRKMKNRRVSLRAQEEETGEAADAVTEVVEAVSEATQEAATVEAKSEPAVDETATDKPADTVENTGEQATESVEETTETKTEETVDSTESEQPSAVEAKDETASTADEKSEVKTEEQADTEQSDMVEGSKKSDDVAFKSTEEEDSIGPLLTDTPKLKKQAKPLRDVADAIKRQLVAADVKKAIDEALVEASSQVSNYRGAYMSWKINKESGSKDEQPVFDYEGIAKSLNLIANETPVVDDEGLEQEPIGKVMTLINVASRGGQYQPQAVSVANYIFNKFEQLDEYESETIMDFQTRSQYIFWLSDKREPRIPSFDECRDDIIALWKQQQAFDLAQAEASRLAESMSDQRAKKLSAVFPDRTVKTGEFTWFSNYGRPAISSVIGVSSPGDDFMSTAFGLGKLETDHSSNGSRDTVYVVQRVSEEQPIDEVATDYMENQFFKFKQIPTQVRDTATWYGNQMNLDWNAEFVEEMGLEYVGY